MSTVYFAKFNFNEEIFNLYKEGNIDELFDKVYRNINADTELVDVQNKKTYNYKFISLDKRPEDYIINGRIVAYAPGTHVSFNKETDEIVEVEDDKKASYVTFSFDIRSEIIGFVAKIDFGKNQFLQRFKNLIDATCDVGEVQLYLATDNRQLTEQMKKFKVLKKMSIELIPPNDERKDFEDLFDLDPEKIEETGARKFAFLLEGIKDIGLKLDSDYVKNFIRATVLGYGIVKAEGINTSNDEFRVNSNKDALFTLPIPSFNKDSIPAIEIKTEAAKAQLMQDRTLIREEIEEEKKSRE